MEAILFIGLQASGKSSFYKQRFADTHIRLNLDMLRTRHREALLLAACLDAKQPFVVDNTNLSVAERGRYIAVAREAGFAVIGYYFRLSLPECLERNRCRVAALPDKAILGSHARLERPRRDEGFDRLHYVRMGDGVDFIVEEYRDEV